MRKKITFKQYFQAIFDIEYNIPRLIVSLESWLDKYFICDYTVEENHINEHFVNGQNFRITIEEKEPDPDATVNRL